MSRTFIKICGITRVEDALGVADAGADAIGLVLWPGSKRAVSLETATAIVDAIPDQLLKVGVFVSPTADVVMSAARALRLHAVQIAGVWGEGDWSDVCASSRVIRTVPMPHDPSSRQVMREGVQDYLLDNGSAGQHGGTGRTFDWTLAPAFKPWGRIWVAGGLTPENVARVIETVRPYAVDVSTGVETAPGIKSRRLVESFIAAARGADMPSAGKVSHGQ